MHHPNVTTKHDKQSRITAGGSWERSSKSCFTYAALFLFRLQRKNISPEKYFPKPIDHESKWWQFSYQKKLDAQLKSQISHFYFTQKEEINWPSPSHHVPRLWQTNKQHLLIVLTVYIQHHVTSSLLIKQNKQHRFFIAVSCREEKENLCQFCAQSSWILFLPCEPKLRIFFNKFGSNFFLRFPISTSNLSMG